MGGSICEPPGGRGCYMASTRLYQQKFVLHLCIRVITLCSQPHSSILSSYCIAPIHVCLRLDSPHVVMILWATPTGLLQSFKSCLSLISHILHFLGPQILVMNTLYFCLEEVLDTACNILDEILDATPSNTPRTQMHLSNISDVLQALLTDARQKCMMHTWDLYILLICRCYLFSSNHDRALKKKPMP